MEVDTTPSSPTLLTSVVVALEGEDRDTIRNSQLATPLNPASNITSNSQTHLVTPVHLELQAFDEAFVMVNYSCLEPLLRRRMRELRLQGLATRLGYSSKDVDVERQMESPPGRRRTLSHREVPVVHGGLMNEVPHQSQQFKTPDRGSANGPHGRSNPRGNNHVPPDKAPPSDNGIPARELVWQSLPWQDNLKGVHLNDTYSTSPLIKWIEEYQFLDGLKVPPHVGYYDRKGNMDNVLHVLEGAIRMEKWAVPVTCHISVAFTSDSVRIVPQYKYCTCDKVDSIQKNLLDRVSGCTSLFLLSKRPKADNTIRVNQLDTILLIELSIRSLDQNQYPVVTSLINVESRKSPTAVLFNADTGRISIRYCEY
ncbi:hypothetical protein Tco_1474030 [Tanacetum coccineum]